MGQKQAAALLRLIGSLAIIASLTITAPSALADDKADAGNGGEADVTVDGGNITVGTVVSISADGGTATADARGGDDNVAAAINTDGAVANAGNGGVAEASANGGTVLQGETVVDPETGEETFVPGTIDAGGNSGGTITVGDVSGDASVAIAGPDLTVTTDVNVSVNGGTANADASGGDGNVATVTDVLVGQAVGPGVGRVELNVGPIEANAGNGGTATANANGGTALLGDVLSGGNVGGVITVGDVVGGHWDEHCKCHKGGGSVDVDIDGGSVTVSTVVSLEANGGTANADARGGDENVATLDDVRIAQIVGGGIGIRELTVEGVSANAGNGGVATANANGGTVEVGDIVSGGNSGNTIQFGHYEEDPDTGELVFVPGTISAGAGGDATVLVNGGTATFSTDLTLTANGGEANADADGGDLNVAVVDDVRIRQRVGGGIGRAILTVPAIAANAGNGGEATADANGGSVTVGDILSGDNTGNTITVGNVHAGGHWDDACKCHKHGGDALVDIHGGDVSSSTTGTISADGGIADADAEGGDENVATLLDVDIVQILGPGIGIAELTAEVPAANAGEGGVSTSSANGGTVVIGNITTGGNSGNTITVGDVSGGGHHDGDCKKDCPPKCEKDCDPKCEKDCDPKCHKDCPKPTPPKKDDGGGSTGGGKKNGNGNGRGGVKALPDTGTGPVVAGSGGANDALLLLGAVVVVAGAGYGLRKRVA